MASRLRFTRLLLVPVIALGLVSHHLHPEDSGWDRLMASAGLVLLVLAMGGRIWASAYLAGKKNRALVVEGPYSVVRNPLYLFSFLGFVGAGLAWESLTLAVLLALLFAVTHWPAVLAEEQTLHALFGIEYERYRRRVPRFVPRAGLLRPSDTLLVDGIRFQAALRDGLAIPLVFVVADLVEWAKLAGWVPVLIYLP